jgi:hypothetical protein
MIADPNCMIAAATLADNPVTSTIALIALVVGVASLLISAGFILWMFFDLYFGEKEDAQSEHVDAGG